MSKLLQRIAESQSHLLGPGEIFEAAAKARTVPGTPTAAQLPPSMLWVATSRRLLVWATPIRGQFGQVVSSLEIGPVVARATIQPYDGTEVALTVFAGEYPAVVIMTADDARAIARIIDRVVTESHAPPPIPPPPPVAGPAPSEADRSLGDERLGTFLDALGGGDWETAAPLLADATPAVREAMIMNLPGRDALGAADSWVGSVPESGDAYVVRAVARVAWAFAERGEGQAEPAAPNVFAARLRAAEVDLWRAVELDFADPLPWTALIASARGLRINSEELCMRFDESVRRCPDLYGAHVETLLGLSRPWAGSHAEMFAFAQTLARPAPEGSTLHALVPLAHLIRSLDDVDDDPRRRYFSSQVSREVAFFSEVSVESDAWVDDVTTIGALNVFALAWHKCGDTARAAALVERIGDRRTTEPWSSFPDGDAIFQQISHSS